MKTNRITKFLQYSNDMKLFSFFWVILFIFFSSKSIFGQEPYYFHTIHSHGLSFIGGRTAKINYMYQINHLRQLKISGTYIYDRYNQGRNRIRANIYIANAQFQYNLINADKFFFNLGFGGGGYKLSAKDKLNIKHKEWGVNFVAGVQAEWYIVRNVLALTVDYDILYMPWSKIYEFVHIPTAGVTLFVF